MPTLTADNETTAVLDEELAPVDDVLADLVGGVDRADEIGDIMIDQSVAPTAGPIVLLSRLSNC